MPTTRTNTRLAGTLALTCAFLLHATKLSWGLRVQNTLGILMLAVLLGIAFSGLLSLADVRGFRLDDAHKTHNFDGARIWEGTRLEANAFVTGLYNVIWYVRIFSSLYDALRLTGLRRRSFIGYSNANYALSEVRDPVRTIKRAAPFAMLSVSIVYMLVNIAYFAVVSKEEILGGGRIVACVLKPCTFVMPFLGADLI